MARHDCTGDVETCRICADRRDVIEYYTDRFGGASND